MDSESARIIVVQLRWIKILIGSLMVPVLFVAIVMGMQYWKLQCGGSWRAVKAQRFFKRVSVLLAEGKYEEIHALCQRRLQEEPTDDSVYLYMGQANYRQGKYREAEAAFLKASDVSPGMGQRVQEYLDACRRKMAETGATP